MEGRILKIKRKGIKRKIKKKEMKKIILKNKKIENN